MEHANSQQSPSIKHRGYGAFYFLIGGGIGATLALLFAPKSGSELRTDITDLTKKGYDETIDLAQQIRVQSAEVFNSVKEKTEKVYDFAASKLSLVNNAIEQLPGEMMDEAAKVTGDEPSNKRISPRKAANIL